MALGLFFFGANIVALTANLLTGAGVLISNPRSFNARLFAGVAVSAACYLVGRLSYAVPADVQVTFYLWPFLLTFMNLVTGLWMMLAYSLFQDERRIPRWMIAAFALQALLSTVNAFGYVGRDDSVLQSEAYPAIVNFIFGPLPLAMHSTFALLALYWAARGWRTDLDESRRLLRGLFLAVPGALVRHQRGRALPSRCAFLVARTVRQRHHARDGGGLRRARADGVPLRQACPRASVGASAAVARSQDRRGFRAGLRRAHSR